ncbi:hypothetical protein DYB28_007400 [Aphanomyces astaci]|uniref:Uncharacterized protein n=1 Tax=Aphanomyces astaci TaxID=112090 RepID=A0A9X8EBE3_APHAT|nr:hypothetical protein DYB28_007400 [Aphanomyces astaci]
MLYPPTPSYQPGPPDPTQHSQDSTDPPSHEEDLDEYDANTALEFPGLRNLCDEGQPILYRTMTMYWEREAHLFQGIQFSINPSLQQPDNPLSIVNFRKEIETICEERFGLTFHGGLSEHGRQLLGTPIQRTALAWAAPRRGYLFLRDISVVMLYQYAGVLSNGLSYHQLEYRNRSKLPPADILYALRAVGATDAIVQSYSPLVSATSTAFTTLDARLLEERSLREAAEHQQSEDQRKLTEAQDRLQTTITQQGTHQEAMAERLPIIESSLRTLMQAMQSVSSQLAGLAALGTPATRLPAAYPAQPTLTPSPPAPDGPVPLNQPAGHDDSMGTDPNDTMESN